MCFPPRMNRSEGGVEVVGSPGAGFVFFCAARARYPGQGCVVSD